MLPLSCFDHAGCARSRASTTLAVIADPGAPPPQARPRAALKRKLTSRATTSGSGTRGSAAAGGEETFEAPHTFVNVSFGEPPSLGFYVEFRLTPSTPASGFTLAAVQPGPNHDSNIPDSTPPSVCVANELGVDTLFAENPVTTLLPADHHVKNILINCAQA